MDDHGIDSLIRLAAEAAALDDAGAEAVHGASCVGMRRLAAIAQHPAETRPEERAHLGRCPLCAGRRRAFADAANPKSVAIARDTRSARIARAAIAVVGLAAAAVWSVSVWLWPSDGPPAAPRSADTAMPLAGASRSDSPPAAASLHSQNATRPLASPAECILCDANCDGQVNLLDVEAFVLALTNPGHYDAAFPVCDRLCRNDANCDGRVDMADIDSFVVCLVGG